MPNTNRLKFIVSSVYSGAGIGLLLGLIMGMSVSPVVQTVIGVLTGMLGALLGLENKLGKTETNESTNMVMNIKLGSFGFGVVFGILFGITIRSHGLFAPTISERVESYKEAGFDTIAAKKYALFEKLGIHPITGETTLDSDEIQKAASSILFNKEDIIDIGIELDTTLFEGDIENAIQQLEFLENDALIDLIKNISNTVPQENHMDFLATIQQMIFESETDYCEILSEVENSNREIKGRISSIMNELNETERKTLINKMRIFFCNLNNQ